jgi:hypothetical protein
MKSRTSLLLVILVLAASSTLTAHASGCTNRTIKGAWVQNLQGLIFLPDGTSLVLTGVTKTTYDGLGNLTALDASGVNGNVPAGWRTGSGSYTVNPDCTGDRDDLVSRPSGYPRTICRGAVRKQAPLR